MLTVNPEIEQAHDSPIITSIAQLTDAELISHFAKREAVAYPALPKATESQLSNADEILVDRFTYTGETFQFEPGFSWMPNPSCDKEWQIAFHKHYFLIDLIQAYRHSCNIVYLQKWQQLIESWIAEMGSGYITLSDAQVEAKRMESWCMAFMLLDGSEWHRHIPGNFLRQFLSRMAEETHYISQNLKRVRNHRTFQLYAIFIVGVLFPELSLQSYFLKTGIELLSENLLTDFQEDGVHIEMSSHYHQLVAETGVRMLELATLNNIGLNQQLVERLHKAVRFSLYLQWPNGDIPLINDSDNGNHLDLLRLGSRYFNDPELLWGATLGKEGKPPKTASLCFPKSGYFILGDHWGSEEESYAQRQHIFFDCGKLGEGSHSHYDLFNFCYYLGGKPAIIDPGRYTYSGEPDADGVVWRHYFKGTAAHNTVTIDKQDQTQYLNRTKHGSEVLLEKRAYLLGTHADWITGCAISENYSPRHERLFVYMGHDYLFIVDRLFSTDEKEHHYELNFHLPAETKSKLTQHENYAQVITDQCEIRSIRDEGIIGDIKPGWVSKYYGIKHQALIFSVSQSGHGNKLFATIVGAVPDKTLTITDFTFEKGNADDLIYMAEFTKEGQYFYDYYVIPAKSSGLYQKDGLEFQGKFLAYRHDGAGNILFMITQEAKWISLEGRIIHSDPVGMNVEWMP